MIPLFAALVLMGASAAHAQAPAEWQAAAQVVIGLEVGSPPTTAPTDPTQFHRALQSGTIPPCFFWALAT